MTESKTVTFVATHGVALDDLGIKFNYDRERTGNKSHRVYAADLDAKKAADLKKLPKEVLKEYGIREAGEDD